MKETLILILFLIVLTSVCDTVSQTCLKASINSLELDVKNLKEILKLIVRIILSPLAWISFTFSLASLFLMLFVLSKAELSFAFSVDSLHYIFIAVSSSIILKEKVGWQRWLGTFLIMIGIVIVSLTGQG